MIAHGVWTRMYNLRHHRYQKHKHHQLPFRYRWENRVDNEFSKVFCCIPIFIRSLVLLRTTTKRKKYFTWISVENKESKKNQKCCYTDLVRPVLKWNRTSRINKFRFLIDFFRANLLAKVVQLLIMSTLINTISLILDLWLIVTKWWFDVSHLLLLEHLT